MGEGVDAEAHRVSDVHEHVDLVLAVAVAGDEAFSAQDFCEGLELQVAAGWADGGGIPATAARRACAPNLPRGLVLAGPDEVIVVDLLDPHAGLGEAGAGVVAPVALLDVLPEGKLDEGRRGREDELVGCRAPTQLDDGTLPADGVRRAVQKLGRGHPASELAVDVDVFAVEGTGDAHFGAAGLGAFVDAAGDGDVAVLVDDAGRHVAAGRVDLLNGRQVLAQHGGRVEVAAHRCNPASVDEDVGPLQHPRRITRPHRRIPDPHRPGGGPLREPVGLERVDDCALRRKRCVRRFGGVGGGGFVGLAQGAPRHHPPIRQLRRAFPNPAVHPHLPGHPHSSGQPQRVALELQAHRAPLGTQHHGHTPRAIARRRRGLQPQPRLRRNGGPRHLQPNRAPLDHHVVPPPHIRRRPVHQHLRPALHPALEPRRPLAEDRSVGHNQIRPTARPQRPHRLLHPGQPRRHLRQRLQRSPIRQPMPHGLAHRPPQVLRLRKPCRRQRERHPGGLQPGGILRR